MTARDLYLRPNAHRRTVRIVKPRSVQRVAMLTMFGITGLSLLVFLGFRLLGQREAVIVPAHRGLEDVLLNWRCEAGHSFRAPGKTGQGICIKCSGPAFPSESFECRQHGVIAVSAKFELDADGHPKVGQFRVSNKEWLDAGDGPKCPKCGVTMARRPRDPLAGLEQPKRRDTRPPRVMADPDDPSGP